jgi:glyceraldehyde-3-phosphate dehydrogenase/erythrose-4-phosphate dehydrogenase
MAYMMKYDSVHGRFAHEIHGDDTGLYIDGKLLAVHAKL